MTPYDIYWRENNSLLKPRGPNESPSHFKYKISEPYLWPAFMESQLFNNATPFTLFASYWHEKSLTSCISVAEERNSPKVQPVKEYNQGGDISCGSSSRSTKEWTLPFVIRFQRIEMVYTGIFNMRSLLTSYSLPPVSKTQNWN